MVIKVGDLVRRKKEYPNSALSDNIYEVKYVDSRVNDIEIIINGRTSTGWHANRFELVKQKIDRKIPWL